MLQTTQTEEKLRRENIKGKYKANQTHYEVGKKVRQNKLVACLDKASEQISSGNIDECYEAIGKLLLEVNSKFLPIERADIGVNTEERYKEYEVSKATGGMTGYPIGIMPIDRQTGGMKDVDLFTFLANAVDAISLQFFFPFQILTVCSTSARTCIEGIRRLWTCKCEAHQACSASSGNQTHFRSHTLETRMSIGDEQFYASPNRTSYELTNLW